MAIQRIFNNAVNITDTGNVGIGTSSPDWKLQIIGTTKAGDDDTNYTLLGNDGTISFTGTAGLTIPHLMQSDSTDQAIADPKVAQVITFDTDVHHSMITRTSSSRFTITKAGSYLITFSGVTKGAINDYINVWLRVNGNDVVNSNTIYQYKSNGATAIVAVNFLEHFDVGDYFEFWTWGSSTGDSWDATAAVAANPGVTPARPACPSIIITANYIGKD
jgi:hypothetical protein